MIFYLHIIIGGVDMNDLACGVKSCAYNDCNCCKREEIKVQWLRTHHQPAVHPFASAEVRE